MKIFSITYFNKRYNNIYILEKSYQNRIIIYPDIQVV